MRAILAGLAMLVAVAGCGGDSTGPREVDVSGAWALRTIAGTALPVTVFESAEFRAEFVDGTLTMRNDGTWDIRVSVRETDAGTVSSATATGGGNWRRVAAGLMLHDDTDGSEYSATISGRTLSLDVGGTVMVFER